MARLDAAELAGVKASVDLGDLVRGHGVALTAQGEDLVGLCPFHSEETPSFRVTPSKGLFHCFGCGESGDAISWVQKTRQVSFRNAVEMLRSHGAKVPPVERRAAVHRGRLDFLMARENGFGKAVRFQLRREIHGRLMPTLTAKIGASIKRENSKTPGFTW